jgi:pantetheine-phosphate adenylyltransferase
VRIRLINRFSIPSWLLTALPSIDKNNEYPTALQQGAGLLLVGPFIPVVLTPLTNGHLDLIQRGAKLFEHLVVAVLNNPVKTSLFSKEERLDMLEEATRSLNNVSAAAFDRLMVDFARQQGVSAVLRGIRAISDYEYEFQMALMNRRLAPEIETVFLQPAGCYSFLSSRMVKEVFSLDGDVTEFVPLSVLNRLQGRIAKI